MKRLILAAMVSSLIAILACAPASEPVSTPKKITLDDAPDILNLSLLLPSRFEHVDAASEGLSKEDLELGSEFSEVQVYLSEDPMQLIYCTLGIINSRTEAAIFDRQIEDEYQINSLIVESIKAGAEEEGFEITVPSVEITHPDIGDSAMLGEGYIESFGYHFGFDTLWFRDNTVYFLIFSVSMSADKVSMAPIADEIAKRISRFSQ